MVEASGRNGWNLPAYALRRSSRARHTRLVLSPRDGLVVVIPSHFDATRVPHLVASKLDWIDRASRRLGADRAGGPAEPALPAEVVLAALGEHRVVRYEKGPDERVVLREVGEHLLVLRGATGEPDAVRAALTAWLTRRARAGLGPWLTSLAAERGLSVGRISIRAQRTRWASCSPKGDVSLNRALVFLPPGLVRHVLHHELCHRVELNHSDRFRALLFAMEPETLRNEVELRAAWRSIPRWASSATSDHGTVDCERIAYEAPTT